MKIRYNTAIGLKYWTISLENEGIYIITIKDNKQNEL